MTDFKMGCSDKCSKEYVRMSVTGTTLGSSLPMIICAAMLTAIPILGIIGYFATKSIIMLIAAGVGVLIGVFVIVFLKVSFGKTAAKLKEIYSKLDGLVCSVAEDRIIVVRDNEPHKIIDWGQVEEVLKGKEGYYLKCKDGMLIVLERDSVLSGTFGETEEILQNKFGDKK